VINTHIGRRPGKLIGCTRTATGKRGLLHRAGVTLFE
jgi:hypothetical protein